MLNVLLLVHPENPRKLQPLEAILSHEQLRLVLNGTRIWEGYAELLKDTSFLCTITQLFFVHKALAILPG